MSTGWIYSRPKGFSVRLCEHDESSVELNETEQEWVCWECGAEPFAWLIEHEEAERAGRMLEDVDAERFAPEVF